MALSPEQRNPVLSRAAVCDVCGRFSADSQWRTWVPGEWVLHGHGLGTLQREAQRVTDRCHRSEARRGCSVGGSLEGLLTRPDGPHVSSSACQGPGMGGTVAVLGKPRGSQHYKHPWSKHTPGRGKLGHQTWPGSRPRQSVTSTRPLHAASHMRTDHAQLRGTALGCPPGASAPPMRRQTSPPKGTGRGRSDSTTRRVCLARSQPGFDP